jgi:hypothetical protein
MKKIGLIILTKKIKFDININYHITSLNSIKLCRIPTLKDRNLKKNNPKRKLDIILFVNSLIIQEKTLGQGTFGKVKLAIH